MTDKAEDASLTQRLTLYISQLSGFRFFKAKHGTTAEGRVDEIIVEKDPEKTKWIKLLLVLLCTHFVLS